MAVPNPAPHGASAQAVPAACMEHLPFGAPQPSFAGDAILCRKRIAIAHDPDAKTPRWVAHAVRSSDAWACEDRENRFRADPDLPRGKRAELSDYAGSGWHRGHMAADGDLRADRQAGAEADYLSNIVPQNPTMNVGLWFRIEELVRVWAAERGEVWVLTIPVRGFSGRRIGANGVLIPEALAKVVIDHDRGDAIAFYVPNASFSWREDPGRFATPIAVVETLSGIVVPKPDGIVEWDGPWPAAVSRFRQAKELLCAASP